MICTIFLRINRPPHGLIHKVPDEATLIVRILTDEIPVFLESADRVTHGVSILALNERLVRIALYIVLALFVVPIHRADNVCPLMVRFFVDVTFILHRAGLIPRLKPVIGIEEVLPCTGLVTETPYNHRRMIAVALNHALHSLDYSLVIVRVFCKGLRAISHSMSLDISLVNNIKSVFVAEVIPKGIVRIVASAHSIEVQLLHYEDIPLHIGR